MAPHDPFPLHLVPSSPPAGRAPNDLMGHFEDLLVDSADVHEFLSDLARMTARRLSGPDNPVSCGVTVIRHKRPLAVANNDAHSRTLDDLQNSYGDGPCLTALREQNTIHVRDTVHDTRWREYLHAAAASDVGSILAVPIDVKRAGESVVNLYSPRVDGFPPASIEVAEAVAGEAARALHLALKIAQLSELRDDLSAALESRTTIATAVGIIMAENRCSRERAFQILADACSHRNIKMRTLAENIVGRLSGGVDDSPTFQP